MVGDVEAVLHPGDAGAEVDESFHAGGWSRVCHEFPLSCDELIRRTGAKVTVTRAFEVE
jgi:hypothetical protein